MTFAERWSSGESLRGIVVRLPARASTSPPPRRTSTSSPWISWPARATSSPSAVWRQWRKPLDSGWSPSWPLLRSVVTMLGADVVITPDDPALRVIDDVDGIGDGASRVALDVTAHLTQVFAALAKHNTASAVPLVLLPGMLGSAGSFADVVAALDGAIRCRSLRIDLDESVADVAESVLAAAPPRFALAGHSLGGIVALEVLQAGSASGHPPRPAQLERPSADRRSIGGVGCACANASKRGSSAPSSPSRRAVNVGERAARPGDPAWVELAGDVGPEGFMRQLAMQASRSDARPSLAGDRRADARPQRLDGRRVPSGDPGGARCGDPATPTT